MKPLLFVLSLVVFLGLLLWWLPPGTDGSPSPLDSIADSPATRSEQSPAKLPEIDSHDGGRVVSDTPARPAAGTANAVVLTGRVIAAETKQPLAACSVRLDGRARSPDALRTFTTSHGDVQWSAPPDQRTGPDGRFAFRFAPPPPFQFALSVQHPDRIQLHGNWRTLEPNRTVDLGDLAMVLGSPVAGRVVDSAGTPQAGVEAVLTAGMRDLRAVLRTVKNVTYHKQKTATDGSFAMHVAPGRYEVYVLGHQVVSPRVVEVTQAPFTLEVVVPRPGELETIGGRVRDPSDDPIAGASVSYWLGNSHRPGSKTDADGRFRIERQLRDPADPVRLSVTARGCESWRSEHLIPWQTEDVEVVLQPNPSLELRVIDAVTRAPVEEFGVRHFRWTRADSLRARIQEKGRHPGGVVRMRSLRRGEWKLVVEPDSPELCASPLLDIDLRDGEPQRRVVELARLASRPVRVERPGGAGVAGTRVELLEPFRKEPITLRSSAVRWGGFRFPGSGLTIAEGTTKATGEVVLRAPPDRDLYLRTLGPGHQPLVLGPLRWLASEGSLVVVVQAGARLEGTLGPPEALPRLRSTEEITAAYPPGPHRERALRHNAPEVSLHREVGSRRESFPPGFAKGVAIDPQGRFTIGGIPPGRWRVELRVNRFISPGSSSSISRALGVVELRDGETTVFQGSVEAEAAPARLSAIVLLNGAPCTGRDGILLRIGAGNVANKQFVFRTDHGGRFSKTLPPGTYRLYVHPAGTMPSLYGERIPAIAPVTLNDGRESRAEFRIETATLSLAIQDADGKPVPDVTLLLSRKDIFWHRPTSATDVRGRVTTRDLPIGPLEVTLTKSASKASGTRVVLGSVHVAPGGTNTVLTLPAGGR